MEHLKNLFDLTKLPAKFFFLFAVISGFILFADNTILEKVQLDKLNETYDWIVGLVFITSSGLVIVNFIIWLFKYIRTQFKIQKIKNSFKERLKNLDLHEQSVIREFLINQQTSIEMPIDDPVVSGLLKKRILVINKQLGNGFMMTGSYTSVSINEYAEKYLNLSDIGLSEKPTEEEINEVNNNRPKWVNKWNY
ncbi:MULTISPECIES: super-infection exclusion protein B [Aequorivita]|uniref:Superinfection exclusion B family protein n=1 Tax=Aequorivita iocasae TaxID=2803865 RepID=A0ABX7DR89_9FLAO|nr:MULTISPECIES: super-infection exclusion protein B [Aequorivita]QQX76650.1 superinfection exclusion B family protein [Aequorivita iocasae]UCA56122.1 superinfection exclusion B family protein [Aequorivita sp. F7]